MSKSVKTVNIAKHVIINRRNLCDLNPDTLDMVKVARMPLDKVTCDLCIDIVMAKPVKEAMVDMLKQAPALDFVEFLSAAYNRSAQDVPRATDVPQCAPDCAESCCQPDDNGVDMEDMPDATDTTQAPEPVEVGQVLYTSAPITSDLPGTRETHVLVGTLSDKPLTVRRVLVPEESFVAQRKAYVRVVDSLTVASEKWIAIEDGETWQPASIRSVVAPASVPRATAAQVAVPDVPRATDTPATDKPSADAPAVARDILLYTNAPSDCDLRRTELVKENAGVYDGKAVRLVKVDPADGPRQTRLYASEPDCVVIDETEWLRHGAAEQGLDSDARVIADYVAQGMDVLKNMIRAGKVRLSESEYWPMVKASVTTRTLSVPPNGTAPKAARAPKASAAVSNAYNLPWRKTPDGLTIPKFEIVAGPKDMSPIPADKLDMETGHCICGKRWYGTQATHRGRKCESCWTAFIDHRNAAIDTYLDMQKAVTA